MLPVTRATLHLFCRTCLKELDQQETPTKNEIIYDVAQTDKLSKWLCGVCPAERAGLATNSQLPKRLCEPCYTKCRTFYDFREKAYCACEVQKELLQEKLPPRARKNLQNFCCTCLKRLRSFPDAVDVFETKNVAEWLLSCTAVDIRLFESELLPKRMCQMCYKKLRNFMEFKASSSQNVEYIDSITGGNSGTRANDVFEEQTMASEDLKCEPDVATWCEMTHESNVTFMTETTITAHQQPSLYVNSESSSADMDNAPAHTASETATQTSCIKTEQPQQQNSPASASPMASEHENSCTDFSPDEDSDSQQNSSTVAKRDKAKKDMRVKVSCPHCPQKFYKKILRDAHVRKVHEGQEKPFECKQCTASFRIIQSLKRHIKEQHGEGSVYECAVCFKTYKQKGHLKGHYDFVHLGIRPYKCRYCDKGFPRRHTLATHELLHTNEKPFVCDVCSKAFRQKADLKMHMDVHTDKKELLCPICNRLQETPEELALHIERHADTKHPCPKCGKTFKKISHLKIHDESVHLKLRPYKCQYCDKKFASDKTCRFHERLHTGERPEICKVCQKSYTQPAILWNHMKKHHPEAGTPKMKWT